MCGLDRVRASGGKPGSVTEVSDHGTSTDRRLRMSTLNVATVFARGTVGVIVKISLLGSQADALVAFWVCPATQSRV
jgi:hypothetical protein